MGSQTIFPTATMIPRRIKPPVPHPHTHQALYFLHRHPPSQNPSFLCISSPICLAYFPFAPCLSHSHLYAFSLRYRCRRRFAEAERFADGREDVQKGPRRVSERYLFPLLPFITALYTRRLRIPLFFRMVLSPTFAHPFSPICRDVPLTVLP